MGDYVALAFNVLAAGVFLAAGVAHFSPVEAPEDVLRVVDEFAPAPCTIDWCTLDPLPASIDASVDSAPQDEEAKDDALAEAGNATVLEPRVLDEIRTTFPTEPDERTKGWEKKWGRQGWRPGLLRLRDVYVPDADA
ncbi:MAG: hypothetical protein HYT80_04260 [Euryarchaeota archaeon]|nr:hypothetical protein [Euryarchaeota archaeon]